MPITARIPQSQPTRGHTMELWQRTQLFNANSVSPDLYNRFFDDFRGVPTITTSSGADVSAGVALTPWQSPMPGWEVFIDDPASGVAGIRALTSGADAGNGVIILDDIVSGTGAADSAVVLQAHPGNFFRISDAASEAKKLGFECRFKVSNVTDGVSSFFIGLAQSGLCTATEALITNAHDLAAISAIGVFRPDADGDGLDVVYKDSAGATTTNAANAITLVADTWYKFGFLYEPEAPADEKIRVWLSGTESSTRITATNIAASTFPDADWLVPTIGLKTDSSTQTLLSVDWIHVLQEL